MNSTKKNISIEDVASWVLRGGVIASVVTMLSGLTISLIHSPLTMEKIQQDRFAANWSQIFVEIGKGRGFAFIELGVLLLILTPILRVASSTVMFALERDWTYALITLVVLGLTLAALLFLR